MKHHVKYNRKNNPFRIVFRMGRRIYLRPILMDDIPFITMSINDHEITQFLMIDKPQTPQDEEKWLKKLSENSDTDIVFAIILVDTDEIIGVMGLHHIDHVSGIASTGAFIGRKDLWNKGYGTEAKMLVLEYAFNTLGLRRIESSVYDFNTRSAACLKKCGYFAEGIRKARKWRNGRFVDEHMFVIFRDNFLPLWEKYRKKFLKQK